MSKGLHTAMCSACRKPIKSGYGTAHRECRRMEWRQSFGKLFERYQKKGGRK